LNSIAIRLKGRPNLSDLLSSLAQWEHVLVSNPRSPQYVPPPANKIEFRLGLGVGDLDRYLFEANVPWEIRRPPSISDADWKFVSQVTHIFVGAHSPLTTSFFG